MRRQFLLILAALAVPAGSALAQTPPAVGVVTAEEKPVTQSNQFVGRIQAEKRVNLIARVSGFLEKRAFEQGTEVKEGDLLYVIEQPPYQAEVQLRQANVNQLQASLDNAKLTLERAKKLLPTPAGEQQTYDTALYAERALEAQVLGAQAQLQTAQINLGYTEIHAPIGGKIGETLINTGNYVGPTSGTLATIVSQDPMYVSFPVPLTTLLELRERYAMKGGAQAVIVKIELPNGQMYGQTGHIAFLNNTVNENTGTILMRGTIANPPLPSYSKAVNKPIRELFDGQFVRVYLEGAEPVMRVAIPRAAVLSDQQGNYVYVVNPENKAEIRRIELGPSSPATAYVSSGLKQGEKVILEGLQRVHPGQTVTPSPASAPPGTAPQ
jgi:membrane fusion protein, multidrug efflux system